MAIAKFMKSICIYCGSKVGDDPVFEDAARRVGREAAARGYRVVYGGGSLGLMGAAAGAARDAGGVVFGVIPQFLVEVEGVLEGVDHKIVKTMHERKMIMFDACDAIVTLPGGIGTLEEVIETLSWARLSLHKKPILVLDLEGFWTPLKTLVDHIVARGFADDALRREIEFVPDVDTIFKTLETRLMANVL